MVRPLARQLLVASAYRHVTAPPALLSRAFGLDVGDKTWWSALEQNLCLGSFEQGAEYQSTGPRGGDGAGVLPREQHRDEQPRDLLLRQLPPAQHVLRVPGDAKGKCTAGLCGATSCAVNSIDT